MLCQWAENRASPLRVPVSSSGLLKSRRPNRMPTRERSAPTSAWSCRHCSQDCALPAPATLGPMPPPPERMVCNSAVSERVSFRMRFGTCKFCNQTKKLVKAHIIPRSFCLQNKGDSKQLLEARTNDPRAVKFWQSGVVDDFILCRTCDNSFSQWDDYGFKILGTPPGSNHLPRNQSELQCFILRDIDYASIKLFVLSVLWRASVSTLPFFAKIRLGPHEQTIAGMLRNRNPGTYDQYSVVLFRLVCQQVPSVVFAPYAQKSPESVNFNMLFLPSIKIMVKTDHRPLPPPLAPVVLKQQPVNVAVPLTLHSNEIATLGRAAKIFSKWLSER